MNDRDWDRWPAEHGVAMVIALMSMTLMLGLGIALVLTTSAETLIAGYFRGGTEARYAADAGIERVVQELGAVPDWTPVLTGAVASSFVDGPPGGARFLADGSIVDLAQATNLANCHKPAACSDADLNAVTADRPWGANNPRWRPFAYGPLDRMLGDAPGGLQSHQYVIVWVADDPSETDDDPLGDGVSVANPGSGVLLIRAEAFGPGGAHRAVEATLRHGFVAAGDDVENLEDPRGDENSIGHARLRVLSWREARE